MRIYIFKNFSGVIPPDPFLQRVEGMRRVIIGRGGLGRGGERRGEEGNVLSKQNL
jgi:hypothetical protein